MDKEILKKENKLKTELEILKETFPQYFDKNGKFLIEKFTSEIIKKEEDISKESYGLEWLGKSYAKVLATEPARTLLKEDKVWNKLGRNKNSKNLLIKGDNLEVLKHLVNAYSEKIKVIYIDPPYNTGSDNFVYEDNRKFTPEELSKLAGISEEKAKRILEFVNSKSNSHSAWLTFMYPRLYIARRLLREDGVIFISIDDNEVAQLRLLMDEIFGEENFVDLLVWRKKSGGGQDDNYFAKEHEYILAYRKTKDFKLIEETYTDDINDYPYEDELGKYKIIKLEKWGSGAYREDAPSLYYPIKDPEGNDYYPKAPDGREGRWRKKPEILVKEGKIEWKKTKNGWKPYEKVYYDPNREKRRKERTILYNLAENTNGTNELKEIFGRKDIFSNPKPTKLIKYLIKLSSNKDSIILDFFAGSGTTGDAVMQLNAEDGGNRKYILVQLPEPIDPDKNKTAYDFVKNELGIENPTIFDITKERLIRSARKIILDNVKKIEELKEKINKIENKKKKTKKDIEKLEDLKNQVEELKANLEEIKHKDFGFKIFETIEIPDEYFKEPEDLTEDLSLFEGYNEEDIDALLTTWKVYDGIPLEEELQEITIETDKDKTNKKSYTMYYGNNKLYLMYKGFNIDILVKILGKIDEDKDFNPHKIVINGYNFTSKAQREIEESVKNFANKKSLNIDVVVRY